MRFSLGKLGAAKKTAPEPPPAAEEVAPAPKKEKSRAKDSAEVQLSLEDLDTLNAGTLGYLRSLPVDKLERRVGEISMDPIEDDAGAAAAAEMLEREGIVIVRNFLDPDRLDGAADAFARVTAALDQATPEQNYEDDDILVQSAERVATTYDAMASHPKSVATVRRGADAGMVDVFNFDRLAGDRRENLREPFSRDWLLRLIAEGDTPLQAENLNLYLNRSIIRTRGLHADSYRKTLKGLVYLSDVRSLDDGPYCFVRRTHVDGPWRQANRKISELAAAKTEAPFVDVGMVVPVVAPRGSLILSDQAGIHRGIPQAPGAERRVLVMRYR